MYTLRDARSKAKKWTRQTLFPSCSRSRQMHKFSVDDFFTCGMFCCLVFKMSSRELPTYGFFFLVFRWLEAFFFSSLSNLSFLSASLRFQRMTSFSVASWASHCGWPDGARSQYRLFVLSTLDGAMKETPAQSTNKFVTFDTAWQIVRYRQAFSKVKRMAAAKKVNTSTYIGFDVNE